jgi:dihydrolipoamide dehydrogenase
MKQYDIVVIGAGPGGYVAAIKAAQSNLSVALIEKQEIGGVCLNWGCIPTKAMLKSAKVYLQAKHAADYGILLNADSVHPDWKQIVARKDKIVKRLTGGVASLLKKNGVVLYQGEGVIADKETIHVNGEILKTKNLILATGASNVVPPIPGLKEGIEKGLVKDNRSLLSIPVMPKRLVVIGGGVIGVEFATLFASFGVPVIILEKLPAILTTIDDEVRDAFLKIFKRQGVQVLVNAEVVEVQAGAVSYRLDGKLETVEADTVLLSVGMRPNVKGLENLNLELEKGAVKTDETLRTSVKNVYAIGDLNGKSMLAHTASAEAIVAVNTVLGKQDRIDYGKIPAAIYSFPEIVTLGLTEKAAREQGKDIVVSRFPIQANGKSLSDGETEGFIKLIADAKYKEILGVHILSSSATELAPELTLAMHLEATAEDIAHSVHMHPTASEIIQEAAEGLIGKAIHF